MTTTTYYAKPWEGPMRSVAPVPINRACHKVVSCRMLLLDSQPWEAIVDITPGVPHGQPVWPQSERWPYGYDGVPLEYLGTVEDCYGDCGVANFFADGDGGVVMVADSY